MIKSLKQTLAVAVAATALVSTASAQITPAFPSGVNQFTAPAFASNVGTYQAALGDLYFDSAANVPSSVQTWTLGPVNLATVFGSNPFLAGGGSVKTIYLGETAGWTDDFGFVSSATPTVHTALVTDLLSNNIPVPGGNVSSGQETSVNYAAGTTLDFFLNSGGDLSQGGLFYAFGGANEFSGADTATHVRWSTRDVPTTFFNGTSVVTQNIKTLLVGFEDTRNGVSFYDGDFNDIVVAFQFLPMTTPPVPEPSTYGIIGAAVLAGLVGLRRFKRNSKSATA